MWEKTEVGMKRMQETNSQKRIVERDWSPCSISFLPDTGLLNFESY